MIYHKALLIKKKFKINSKVTPEYLKFVLHSLNCNVSTYSEERMKLALLGLTKEAKKAPALSVTDEDDNTTVYYNDKLPISTQRIALSHEIGHLVLGHRHKKKNKRQERDANRFAKYLLSPQNILYSTIECILYTLLLMSVAIILLAAFNYVLNDNNNTVNSIFETFNSSVSVPESSSSINSYSSANNNNPSKNNTDSALNSKAENNSSHTSTVNSGNELTDSEVCYYTKHGTVYHLYEDCYHIQNSEYIYSAKISECHLDIVCRDCEHRNN